MNIVLNFKELIRQYVAPYRRGSNRLKWLWGLVDLQAVYDTFSAWRDYYPYKVHVTSQHKAFHGHLNIFFGGGIFVICFYVEFLDIGLISEPAHWVIFEPMQEIALEGEGGQSFIDVDFIVYAPEGIDRNLLSAEIEKYKLADKAYKIVTRK